MSEIGQATTLQLSAEELRNLTKWPDSVIIEFLSLQGSVGEISQTINVVINNIDQNVTQIVQAEATIQVLRQAAIVQTQEIASLTTQIASQQALIQKLAKSVADLEQLIYVSP